MSLQFILLTASKAAHTASKVVPTEIARDENTYAVARLLMKFVHWIMDLVGAPNSETLFMWLYVIVVCAVSIIIGEIIKWILVWALRGLSKVLKSKFYSYLAQRHFFVKACRIIPPLIFLILIQFTLYLHMGVLTWLTRIAWAYFAAMFAWSLCTLCDVIWRSFDERDNVRKLPLKGIVQVVKFFIWAVAIVIIAAVLVDKSPGTLLAGLGAFAAVLMLVFRDSILGIVAGVQLSQNDSLHVGDWISIPDSDANGTVDEVSLTQVKIINWDKTVSTIPPYSLLSKGFKNMRNMQISHTRRIQRSYMIDADSVMETTEAMLDEFAKIPLMTDWIAKKREQKAAGKTEDVANSAGLADGTIDTNLGVFRAYMQIWLSKNPNISHADTCFVTTLPQTTNGIPLQIYCFTSTSSWIPYEGIMAGVFEHMAAMLYKFNLYTFEAVTGRDTLADGFMSPGKNPAPIFGIPYPFFRGSGTPLAPGTPPDGVYKN